METTICFVFNSIFKFKNEFDSQIKLMPKLNEQNKFFLDLIQSNKEAVCLHVRRGDYVNLAHAM